MSTTIDVQAIVHAALSAKLTPTRVNPAALTDTLNPEKLPVVIYEISSPTPVRNAPRAGHGTVADVTLTALAASRVRARDVCDAAVGALLDSVDQVPGSGREGWLTRVRLTQEPMSITSAQVAGATIYQYTAVTSIVARRNNP